MARLTGSPAVYPAATMVGLVAAGLAGLAAVAVYALGPGRLLNRVLALFLFFEGSTQFAAAMDNSGLSRSDSAGVLAVFTVSIGGVLLFYLVLLGSLDTPLVAPFRSRWLMGGIALTLTAIVAYGLSRMPDELPTSADVSVASLIVIAVGIAPIFGFVAALHALRRAAPGSVRRGQARAFMLAFGARDVFFFLYALAIFIERMTGSHPAWVRPFGVELPYFAPLVFVPLMTYGILQAHLFDIDAKVKIGVRRGTIVTVFVAVFLAATEAAQPFLAARLGPLVGIAAAAALLFVLAPLQRVADRVANAAMPEVRDSSEYYAFRKLEVYKAAVESAHESGGISPKERASLARLRDKLGVPADAATRLEADVTGGAA